MLLKKKHLKLDNHYHVALFLFIKSHSLVNKPWGGNIIKMFDSITKDLLKLHIYMLEHYRFPLMHKEERHSLNQTGRHSSEMENILLSHVFTYAVNR